MTADFPTYAEENGGATADTIREAAEAPSSHTETINALVSDLANDRQNVQSAIEGDIADIASANPDAASQTAQNLARNGYYAIGLINQFADAVEAYDSTVEQLNTELHQNTQSRVLADRDADEDLSYNDIKAEEKAKLQGRFNQAVSTLESAESTAVTGFQGGPPSEAEAKQLMLAGYLPLGAASLWPGLQLTPQESYQAYQNAVRTGTIPSVTEMTEFERQQWMEQNPGLVQQWMQIEDPSDDLKAAIIGLSLPKVTSEDAEDDASWLLTRLESGNMSPVEFERTLSNLSNVNGALAVLAPWAARNNVDLAANPGVAQAQEYLKTFYEDTYSKKDEILEYINADEHRWTTSYTVSDGTHYDNHSDDGFSDAEKNGYLSMYADGILNLSNHDLGGGYDDLPQALRDDATQNFTTEWLTGGGFPVEVQNENKDFWALADLLSHSTTEPGDGLAKQMASTAVGSMSAADYFWGRAAGGDEYVGQYNDLVADMLDMTSRNREATADLVAGTDVPGNYPHNFNSTLFNQPWDLENGNEGKVAKMYSWMAEDYASDDPADRARADAAFDKLSQDLTSVDGGNFETLMGPKDEDGDGGDSAAYRNTLLTRGLVDALAFNLDSFAAPSGTPEFQQSPLSEADRVRLMTFIASDRVDDQNDQFDLDRGAGRLTTYVTAYQQDQLQQWAENPTSTSPRELAGHNARLQALLDVGLTNEAEERGLTANQAEAERVRNLKIGAGIVTSLAGKIPVAGDFLGPATGIGNTLISNLVTAEHLPSPSANLPAEWQVDGSHVTGRNALWMINSLVDNGKIDPSDLPPELADPTGQSSATLRDRADALLTQYFEGQGVENANDYFDAFEGEINNVYNEYKTFYGLSNVDDINIGEFLTSSGWGRP
ncbi:MAG: hypothetical protein PGN07_02160 [Aeromicrobium erythreum]